MKVKQSGILCVHDTTDRRQHYTKNFQHTGTRRFGVYEAVRDSQTLREHFKLLKRVDDMNGVDIYERL